MSTVLLDGVFAWVADDQAVWIEIPETRPQMRLLEVPVELPEDVASDQLRTTRFVRYTGDFDVF